MAHQGISEIKLRYGFNLKNKKKQKNNRQLNHTVFCGIFILRLTGRMSSHSSPPSSAVISSSSSKREIRL